MEIKMLKDIITDTKRCIEALIDADMYDDVADARIELVGYEEELARYEA